MYSIISISPESGHVLEEPSAQKAGHRPGPAGSLMRAAALPYKNSIFSLVLIRPEMKSKVFPSAVTKHGRDRGCSTSTPVFPARESFSRQVSNDSREMS